MFEHIQESWGPCFLLHLSSCVEFVVVFGSVVLVSLCCNNCSAMSIKSLSLSHLHRI